MEAMRIVYEHWFWTSTWLFMICGSWVFASVARGRFK